MAVHTVRGPVEVADLGAVLTHEHVVMSSPEFARDYPELAWPGGREAAIERAVAVLQAVAARGIRTIVDCTVFLHGRDLDFLQRVNSRVDLNIVVSTGIYSYDWLPYVVKHRDGSDPDRDILTRMFIRDLREGIGDSGVRAQNIKVATDKEGLTPANVRMLRAAAAASVATGAPITTHTDHQSKVGLRQLDIFAEQGVALEGVVVGHSGDSTDLDYLRAIMDRGATIASDRFGLNGAGRATEPERIETIARLCAEGYSDRIVVGHDSMMVADWLDSFDHYPDTWTPTHVSDVILPALRAAGVSDAHLEDIMVNNPARLLARNEAS